jgi:L-rhamnose mutarotase
MERVGFCVKVKADKLDDYRARHREVWPDMLDALRETGWRNYSLFLREDGLLFGYVEVDDYEACLAGMAKREVNDRWQSEMSPFFEAVGESRPDESFLRLDEVFHLE